MVGHTNFTAPSTIIKAILAMDTITLKSSTIYTQKQSYGLYY